MKDTVLALGDLLNMLPDVMVIVDGTGRIVFVNTPVHGLLGYTPDELVEEHRVGAPTGWAPPPLIEHRNDIVEVDFREDGLRAIAEKAMERKTGARGLRSILEGVLLESMYNIPSQDDVSKVVIDESVIKGDSEPLLVYQSADTTRLASTEE